MDLVQQDKKGKPINKQTQTEIVTFWKRLSGLQYVRSGSTKFMPSSSIDSIPGNVVLLKLTEIVIDTEVNCAWELILDLYLKSCIDLH